MHIYTASTLQYFLNLSATVVGLVVLFLTARAVIAPSTSQVVLFKHLVFWSLAPALWFALEFHYVFKSLPSATDPQTAESVFKSFEYGQDLAAKFWAAVLTLVGVRIFNSDHIK